MIIQTDARGWRRFYCPVCGHVEWVAPGQELPEHYACPLCGAGRAKMLALDDKRLERHSVEVEELSPGLWRASKRPPFHREYNHFSYILAHPEGVLLFDAPPVLTPLALETVNSIGRARLLVVSHQDFVGFAGDWAAALGVPSWMGEGDEPLPGNRFVPDERVTATRKIFEDVEIVPVPGHSPGSLAVYWGTAPGGPILCAGDALGVWEHPDGRTQLSFLQESRPGREICSLIARPVGWLATCTGTLAAADRPLKELLAKTDNCARPWRGETGGVWLDQQSAGPG
ncbi:MAG TPA: hypothetical protein VJQ56_06685 [Blastocatellia bacterium]|nr:hypothetical protein [Blastocatellia bacterium]